MKYELWVVKHNKNKWELVASAVNLELLVRLKSDLEYDGVYQEYRIDRKVGK